MLVALPLVRSDYVKAFKGPSGTDTPNLNELTGNRCASTASCRSACPRCRCGARS